MKGEIFIKFFKLVKKHSLTFISSNLNCFILLCFFKEAMQTPLQDHPGLSEEDVKAAEVLGVLRRSSTCYNPSTTTLEYSSTQRQQPVNTDGETSRNDITSTTKHDTFPTKSQLQTQQPTLLNRVVNNVVNFYDDFQDRKRVASIAKLLDDAYEDNYSSSEGDEPDSAASASMPSRRVSKRQKISRALAKGKDNLREYKLNMSIESKKRLVTCLHLLKLANKQLSDKITCLQELVREENEDTFSKVGSRRVRGRQSVGPVKVASVSGSGESSDNDRNDNSSNNNKTRQPEEELKRPVGSDATGVVVSSQDGNGQGRENDDDDDDEDNEDDNEKFYDAVDTHHYEEESAIVKMEVVGTVKKVYELISRFTGNALPEPARSQVRESLLNLPSNWFSRVNNSFFGYDANGSVVDPHITNGSSGNSTAGGPLTGTVPTDTNGENSPQTTLKFPLSGPASPVEMGMTSISTNSKVLILAKESLNMVQNVMDVVDSTLGKAEEWVKQRQEVKEMIYKRFLERQAAQAREKR